MSKTGVSVSTVDSQIYLLDKEVQTKDNQLETVRLERDAEVARMTSDMEKNKNIWTTEKEMMEQEQQNLQSDNQRQQLVRLYYFLVSVVIFMILVT